MSRLDKISSFKMTRSQQRKSKLKTQVSRKQMIYQKAEFYEDNSDIYQIIKAIEASPITSGIIKLKNDIQLNHQTPELTYEISEAETTQELPEEVLKMQQMPSKGSPVLRRFKKRAKDYIPRQLISDKDQPQRGEIKKMELTPMNPHFSMKLLSMKSQEFIKIRDKGNSDLRPCKTVSITRLNTRSNSLIEKRKKLLNITAEEIVPSFNEV